MSRVFTPESLVLCQQGRTCYRRVFFVRGIKSAVKTGAYGRLARCRKEKRGAKPYGRRLCLLKPTSECRLPKNRKNHIFFFMLLQTPHFLAFSRYQRHQAAHKAHRQAATVLGYFKGDIWLCSGVYEHPSAMKRRHAGSRDAVKGLRINNKGVSPRWDIS